MSTPVPLACRCDFPDSCRRTGECQKLRWAAIAGIGPVLAPESIAPPTAAAPIDPTGKQGRGGPR